MPGHLAPPRYALLPTRFYKEERRPPGQRDLNPEREEANRFQELDIAVLRYDPKDEKHSAIEEILEEWCGLAPIKERVGFPDQKAVYHEREPIL
jgi:hypothetical protein